jgi:hypothetical protein
MVGMNANPHESPSSDVPARKVPSGQHIVNATGTAILIAGLAVLIYGAVAFWIIPSLPPNDASSRLPSLYVMGAGIITALVGLTFKSLQGKSTKKGAIPTSVGVLVLLAIIIAFFVAVSRL